MDSYKIRRYYIKFKDALFAHKNKEFLIFLLFFFMSAVFWLMQSLNETLAVELKVPLRLVNVPENVVITTDLPSELTVKVQDKGSVLVRYLYGGDRKPVELEYADYDRGVASGRVLVPVADVAKVMQSRLLSSSRVVSVHPDTLEYFFNRGARKKVPVRLSGEIETSPEYYLKGVTFSPDSVELLAPAAILDTVEAAYTTNVHMSDLSANTSVVKDFKRVRGGKFIPCQSTLQVTVDLYTEKTVEVPVEGVNFPAEKSLRTFPSNVKVSFRLGLSRFKEVTADDFVIALSYEELLENQSSKVRLYLKSAPEGISNVRIQPEEVDYLIEYVEEEGE